MDNLKVNKSLNTKATDWLTPELRIKVKNIFEARYKRELSENEVFDIANNLTSYMEHLTKFMSEKSRENNLY